MKKKSTSRGFPPEIRERAMRRVEELRPLYSSDWATFQAVAPEIGCKPVCLGRWWREYQHAQHAAGVQQSGEERIRELEREHIELQRVNEELRKMLLFSSGGIRPKTKIIVAFIDKYRTLYGAERMCALLPIAPSTYYLYHQLGKVPQPRG